jgi:NAD(P)-dependent dehydrogenase (short-subunit alcohol dehydrogenase family)
MPVTGLFDLTGTRALITGSSRGIGLAIATRMAEAGARVTISSRKSDACQAAADAINQAHGDGLAIPIPADISVRADLENLVETANSAWGGIDLLICNAASNPHYGPLAGITDELFRKAFENNVLSTHWLISLVAPGMRARRDGAITIISSIGGLTGSAAIGAYNISKAADMQLARNLAVEFGKDNVRVNCIAPGLVRTAFSRALWTNPGVLGGYEAKTPLGRIGEADEIAGTAIFLSTRAGSFVTGQTIVVDGGVTIAGVTGA